MILWNLSLPSDRGVEREVDAHSRAITDINWAVYSLNIVATGGIDGWVKVRSCLFFYSCCMYLARTDSVWSGSNQTWDIRTPMRKDASRFASWGWGCQSALLLGLKRYLAISADLSLCTSFCSWSYPSQMESQERAYHRFLA